MANQAAWITGAAQRPLKVGPGPEPNPGEKEVVIKVAYAAVNPVDWKLQGYDFLKLPYPNILGSDVAGEIVKAGPGVTRFKQGDRVIAHCDGLGNQKPTHGAFQFYTTCLQSLVSAIPSSLPFANAAVLPLSISTATAGLFQKTNLGLPFPSTTPKPTGKTVLIWGGSSSVGSSAIQLAVAAGLTVVTTASKRNFEYVKSLGASYAVDHSQGNVVEVLLAQLKGSDFAGAFDAISTEGTIKACAEIVSQLGGGVLPIVLPAAEGLQASLPDNVKVVAVSGLGPTYDEIDVGEAVWGHFIPMALAEGKFQAKPDPQIITGGLEAVQQGLDTQKAGVSAAKIVVELQQLE